MFKFFFPELIDLKQKKEKTLGAALNFDQKFEISLHFFELVNYHVFSISLKYIKIERNGKRIFFY